MIRIFRSASLALRISSLLILAMASIAATAGLFWVYLYQSSDTPALIDDLGRQRMLSMQMVAGAHELDYQPQRARRQLEEAATQFDRTLDNLLTQKRNSLFFPSHCEELAKEARELWGEIRPHIDTLLTVEAQNPDFEEARTHVIEGGPELRDLSDRIVEQIREQAERNDRRMLWVMLGALLFNTILLLAGFILTRRHIVHPLRQLDRAAQKLRSGHFRTRISQNQGGEIGHLEETFNEMAQEMESLVHSLKEERGFAEAIVTHAPAGVVVHRQGEVLFTNPKFIEMTGVDHTDDFCDEVTEIFLVEDRTRARQVICPEVHDDPSPQIERLRLSQKRGGVQTVEVVSVPIDYRGTATTLTVLRDLTERQELTARMMQMDRVMAIGTLVAGVGHEINNPLSYTIANLEYTLRQLQGDDPSNSADEEVLEALRESLEGAGRIRDIVKQLRSFTGGHDSPRRPIDIRQPLESAIRMAHSELRHRAQLLREFADVPTVRAQKSKIAQVFLNLLVNAAHAIEEADGDDTTITVRLYPRDERVVVEIEDTGGGIPQEIQERLFDPFFTTKSPGEGTGLGLPICQKIVESHDGVITFDTEVGRGTTFRISLPAANGARDFATPTPNAEVSPGDAKKIAVVDDEKMVGRLFSRALKSHHDVDVITDPRRFLDALDSGQRYDLIFCDLMMPNLTGMELYERIEVDYPDLKPKMVFITGGAVTASARQFLEDIDPPLLYKPFSLRELREIVADFQPCPSTEPDEA